MPKPLALSSEEIAASFADPATAAAFPPVLTIKQAAALLGLSVRTIKHYVALDYFAGATRLVGKHRRFFRDRLIKSVFALDHTGSPSSPKRQFKGTSIS